MSTLSSFLSELSNLENFLSGLTIVNTLNYLEFNSFETDADFNIHLAASLYIPLSDVSKCFSIISRFSNEFKYARMILCQAVIDFFRNTILTFIIQLCDSIIMNSSSDWICVLPLIHAIELPDKTTRLGPSYEQRSTTEKKIVQHLFCGLNVKKFQITDPKYVISSNFLLQLLS